VRGRQQADGQIRAWPSVVQCVGVEVVELGRPLGEPCEVLFPGLYRIGLVEPHAEGDLLPQPLDVGLAEDLCRPALVRGTDAAPVDVVLGELLYADLHDLLRYGAADTLAVEVCEQLRLRVARRRDHRVAAHRGGERLQPLGRVRQRLVRAQLDHRPPHMPVGVAHVHVRGAGAVGLASESPRKFVMPDVREEEDLLARLDIGAYPDDELRVGLEAFVHRAIVCAAPRS
jgi:hypothetical protein